MNYSGYTFNDDVTWENINFLIQCYLTLGQERFLDPIKRGMNFYLLSQDGCGAWGQQLNMDLEAASARTYEPAAFLPSTTCENARLLLKFYRYTGDKRFLSRAPDAIRWLEETALPADQAEGERTHPTFVDTKTNKPLYVHRKGSNVAYGYYFTNEDYQRLLSHYYGKCRVPLQELKEEYEQIAALSPEEATKDSPIKPGKFEQPGTPQKFYDLNRFRFDFPANEEMIRQIISSLDQQNRWLAKHAMISNPYTGNGKNQEMTDQFSSVNVGDETDTSPYRDTTDQEYISTGVYIRNMHMLINYLKEKKAGRSTEQPL